MKSEGKEGENFDFNLPLVEFGLVFIFINIFLMKNVNQLTLPF